jgi:hypothetical protein
VTIGGSDGALAPAGLDYNPQIEKDIGTNEQLRSFFPKLRILT